MAKTNKFKSGKKLPGSVIAAFAVIVIVLAAIAGYWLFSGSKKTVSTSVKPVPPPPVVAPQLPFENISALAPNDQKEQKDTGGSKYPEVAVPREKDEDRRPVPDGTARLAIIIDDMGSSMSEARSLASIGVPLTFSIIPGLQKYREVASYAASGGIETMIHMPMQSKDWPRRRLEANGLLVSMSDEELRQRVSGYIKDLPDAVGANNHTGSEFTEHQDQMRSVLETLKGKGLFFVDSMTTPNTAGIRLARELGIKSGRRGVFLDNEQERSYILGQLNQAVRSAKKNGAVIAICHPHPATISALASALPGLAGQGITLVHASDLVR